jgi:tartrate dehydratase beta subunit/fumarate hydratase class I family protein
MRCISASDKYASYLIAVGGAAYLISKSIKKAKKIAFAEMGMEAIFISSFFFITYKCGYRIVLS